ncbi:MAG: hypothetical protein V2A76_13870, partial [Planctomycetota bacterium]
MSLESHEHAAFSQPSDTGVPAGGSGDDQEEAAQKKEAADRLLHERLATIIRTISSRPDLQVTTELDPVTMLQMAQQGKDARREWFRMTQYDPLTREVVREYVHIPPEISESNEDVAKGKAAHEAGHVAITRFGEFVPDEVIQELGFHGAMAAAEE